MSDLAKMECIPCKEDVPPLKLPELTELLDRLDGGWQGVDEHRLEKEYLCRDFRTALAFTNRVCEARGHHPDIYLSWGKVRLSIWAHKINGLTESDFIFADKADVVAVP